jgi:hypothetical protein
VNFERHAGHIRQIQYKDNCDFLSNKKAGLQAGLGLFPKGKKPVKTA